MRTEGTEQCKFSRMDHGCVLPTSKVWDVAIHDNRMFWALPIGIVLLALCVLLLTNLNISRGKLRSVLTRIRLRRTKLMTLYLNLRKLCKHQHWVLFKPSQTHPSLPPLFPISFACWVLGLCCLHDLLQHFSVPHRFPQESWGIDRNRQEFAQESTKIHRNGLEWTRIHRNWLEWTGIHKNYHKRYIFKL